MSIFSKFIDKRKMKKVTIDNSSVINTILDNQLRTIKTNLVLIDILEKKGVMSSEEFNTTMNRISNSSTIKDIENSFNMIKNNTDIISDDELEELLELIENT